MVHVQTARPSDCIIQTAGYPRVQPSLLARLLTRKRGKYTLDATAARKQIELKGQSPPPTPHRTLINKSVENAREPEAMKISHSKVASSALLNANWVPFNRPMNGCSSLANTPTLCYSVRMTLMSYCSLSDNLVTDISSCVC